MLCPGGGVPEPPAVACWQGRTLLSSAATTREEAWQDEGVVLISAHPPAFPLWPFSFWVSHTHNPPLPRGKAPVPGEEGLVVYRAQQVSQLGNVLRILSSWMAGPNGSGRLGPWTTTEFVQAGVDERNVPGRKI